MELVVVIINYKTPGDTIVALESLENDVASLPGTQVVIVENGSGDDSGARIQQVIDQRGWSWARLLVAHENIGFACGNNLAVEEAMAHADRPRYFMLLNPDTSVRSGAVRTMWEFLEAHPGVGLVGPRLEDPDGTPQRSAFRFPTVWSELEYGLQLGWASRALRRWVSAPPPRDDAHPTDWVAGAALMIRREVIEKLGLFDPKYFMYYEEVDFCMRARRAGWACWYVPQAHVVHLVGRASGITVQRPQPKRRPSYWFVSRRWFFVKNRGTFQAAAADLAFALGFACWRLRRRIQRKPDLDPPHMLWDFLRYSVLTKRTRV